MIKHFLNSILLISFLTVFSVDSINSLFELDNTIFCELADLNDGEDSNKEELNKMESEAVLANIPNIEVQCLTIDTQAYNHLFFISNSYSLKIPTPPPENNI